MWKGTWIVVPVMATRLNVPRIGLPHDIASGVWCETSVPDKLSIYVRVYDKTKATSLSVHRIGRKSSFGILLIMLKAQSFFLVVLCFTKVLIYKLLHESHNAPPPYPTMHYFVTEMCTCVYISVTNSALWDIFLMHCGICFMHGYGMICIWFKSTGEWRFIRESSHIRLLIIPGNTSVI